MGKNNREEQFRFPFSSFVGSRLGNFLKVAFRCGFDLRYTKRAILSLIIALILEPFRWINRLARFIRGGRHKKAESPWFIIGFWRSGTTLMHQLLCEDRQFYYVSTFQTIFPELMLFKRPLSWIVQFFMPRRRPVDHMKLSLDAAQEEEIGLANLFPFSFYHFLYFPNDYENTRDRSLYLDNMPPGRKQRWLRVYNKMILDAQKNKGGVRLLSKSPSNTFRIKQLAEFYPGAKFIYLYRDPYSVLSSFRLFITEVIRAVGFREIPDEEFNDCMVDLFLRMEKEYREMKHFAGEGNLVEVRFEDFVKDPLKKIEEIYAGLGVEFPEEVRVNINNRLVDYANHEPGDYVIPQDVISLVNGHLGDYMKKHGYTAV